MLGGGGPDATVTCSIANDAAQNFTVEAGQLLPLSMSATLELVEPDQTSLVCLKQTGSPSIAQAHIIATRVTKINESTSPG